ncbi:bifunctional acetate--CoA ligase family protein/GNAT family N-acetyltransferase [Acidocella aromatica]|uniref:Acetyltransferase n=1 Tax=Acidocella aromatica TaxID=1303579 RepID=A0A840VEE6_9PROT|nr:GNAT family N-acetyltransferase [Acidocella aromatica]MBB5374114.1 acetyltransferase [Acidocella aromatica]
MTIASKRRFDAARFFHPERVSLSGAGTAFGKQILANLRAGGFTGEIGTDDAPLENADVALVADAPGDIQAALLRHARMGARGAFVLSHKVRGLAAMAREAKIRVVGPHSFGLILPGLGLNASPFALTPQPGRMALVGQSSSIARTVIDWAAPNAVGFSHLVGIGGNTDIGFGLVLDQLSRDPNTAAIMVEIDRLRDPKLFFSAARAAARLRPVVAIVPGMRMDFPGAKQAAALEAAMARAGVLLTSSISEFLAAAETLTRVKPVRGDNLAIITNSTAIGRLAADEALRSGVPMAELAPETRQVLSLTLGKVPATGPIFVGKGPTRLAEAAAQLSSAPEVGGILVVHAPSDDEGDTAIETLIACAQTVKVPLLISVMGEAQGLRHRHMLSEARFACFDTPESAVAGFRHLLRNRHNRAAARELPDATVLRINGDKAHVAAQISAARAHGQNVLLQDEALALVSAYNIKTIESRHVTTPDEAAEAAEALGYPAVLKLSHPDVPTHLFPGSVVLDLPDAAAVRHAGRSILARLVQRGDDVAKAGFVVQAQAPRSTLLRVRVSDHPVLGPLIGFGAGGGDPDDVSLLAADLPPLNLTLARALIHRAQVAPLLAAHRGQEAADEEAIAAILVRVSQLILDTPEIALLDLDPVFANETGAVAGSARIVLRPPGAVRPEPIISPYPADLASSYEAKGMKFTIRPVRPEDADAHIAMVARLTPEDMRYRFFSPMKSLPVEQITRMTDVDYTREMAFIAKNEATGATMGVARLVRDDTDGLTGEFAVSVEPAAKGLGLGSALMRAIIEWGRAREMREIAGQVLADNAPMLSFIKHLGFTVARIPDEPDVVEAKLAL